MTEASGLGSLMAALLDDVTVRRATLYISSKLTLKATRQRPRDGRERAETYIVTVGRPNYREQKWIKAAKKAGVAFPVRAPQLTFWPKRRG